MKSLVTITRLLNPCIILVLYVAHAFNGMRTVQQTRCLTKNMNRINSFLFPLYASRTSQKAPISPTKPNNPDSETLEWDALKTDPISCRTQVKGGRVILAGDYVVIDQYGIGQFMGIKMVDIGIANSVFVPVPVCVIRFADAEIRWLQRCAADSIYMYRQREGGEQEVSSILNLKRWKRQKAVAVRQSEGQAVKLLQMTALRNAFHRIPCVSDDERYAEFERNFAFEPTDDQKACFEAVEKDMVHSTRPMDRLICGDVGFG